MPVLWAARGPNDHLCFHEKLFGLRALVFHKTSQETQATGAGKMAAKQINAPRAELYTVALEVTRALLTWLMRAEAVLVQSKIALIKKIHGEQAKQAW